MNPKSQLRPFALILALAVALPGCGGPDPVEEAKEPLSVIFDAFKRSDIEGALMLYAPTFFRSTSRQQWLKQLSGVHQQMGPVVSYEILRSSSEKKTSPVSGTYVQYECKVNYQRGSLRETLVLVRPDGLQHFTVSGHAITATASQAGVRQAPQGQPGQPQAQPAPPAAAPKGAPKGAPQAAPAPAQPQPTAPPKQAAPATAVPQPPAAQPQAPKGKGAAAPATPTAPKAAAPKAPAPAAPKGTQ